MALRLAFKVRLRSMSNYDIKMCCDELVQVAPLLGLKLEFKTKISIFSIKTEFIIDPPDIVFVNVAI